ncbi:MAG: hypothetical protein HYX71_04120 [Opitutae bacterium]|nr:hypothetical protein [Opitutae bacterium]
MRHVFATVLLASAVVVSAAPLSPKALDYLKELGIDPDSAEVTGVLDDQINRGGDGKPFNLEAFATRRSESGVRNFIATRNFVRKFQKDPKTPFPSNDVYQMRYVTPEEVQFIRTALGGKLQPVSLAFLKELEIDTESEQITAIIEDQVGQTSYGWPYSLDTLAGMRDETAVRAFIATRNFVRKYMKDTKTPFPPREVYQVKHLKPDEVQFILNELKKPFDALREHKG